MLNLYSGLFNKSLSHEYRLSLKIGVNGISYLIVDGMEKAVIFKQYILAKDESITNAVKTFFTGDSKMLLNYKSIKISLDSDYFTLIPERLFKEKDRELYLDKTARKKNNLDFVSDDYIPFNKSKLVYSWNKELINVLKNYFPSSRIFHLLNPLLRGWKKQSEIKEGKKIFLHVETGYFTISFFQEAELIFINRFHYKTASDFLYYVLLIFDQFELKPETSPVIISGELVENSEIYKKLFRYIRHLQFIPNIGYYDFNNAAFSNLTHYHHFDLYSLKLCE